MWQTLALMGVGYVVFMLGGAFGYRVPPAGWRPDGWTPPAARNAMARARQSSRIFGGERRPT